MTRLGVLGYLLSCSLRVGGHKGRPHTPFVSQHNTGRGDPAPTEVWMSVLRVLHEMSALGLPDCHLEHHIRRLMDMDLIACLFESDPRYLQVDDGGVLLIEKLVARELYRRKTPPDGDPTNELTSKMAEVIMEVATGHKSFANRFFAQCAYTGIVDDQMMSIMRDFLEEYRKGTPAERIVEIFCFNGTSPLVFLELFHFEAITDFLDTDDYEPFMDKVHACMEQHAAEEEGREEASSA